jgi:putative flippase GtrA
VTTSGGAFRRVSRFGVIGVINTALDFGLFALLAPRLGIIPATIVSTGAAMVFSYIANAFFVFGATALTWKSAAEFFGFNALNLWVLQAGVIQGLDYVLRPVVDGGYPRALLAKLVSIGLSMILNYLVYDRFIWPRTSVRQR